MHRRVMLLAVVLGLSGCSGARLYSYEGDQNLTIESRLDADVEVSLHISRVDEKCQAEYQGRVPLEQSSLTFSIPADQISYVDVVFDTSSFLAGKRTMSVGALLKPRVGYHYRLVVSYRGDLYNVRIHEINPGMNTSRQLPRRDLWNCGVL